MQDQLFWSRLRLSFKVDLNMKTAINILRTSLGIILITLPSAYGQTWDWALPMGSDEPSGDYGEDIVVDSDGNSYSTGYFAGNGVFGDTNLITNGSRDIFLIKLDIHGNLVWARNPGGDFSDAGLALALDSNDDLIVTGFFSDIGQFGSHSISATPGEFAPRRDCFVAKYHKNGDCLWVKNITNSPLDDWLTDVAVDSQNNVYVIGTFTDTLTTPDTLIVAEPFGLDFFLIKYDADGNYLWIKHGNTPETEMANLDIVISRQDVIYIKGHFKGDLSFNSQLLFSGPPNSSWNAFLMRIDTNGNHIWNETFDITSGNSTLGSITTNSNNDCILSFHYQDSLVLSDTILTCEFVGDAIIKYNSQGEYIWSNQITPFNYPLSFHWYFNGLSSDESGNTYHYGSTSSSFVYGDDTVMYPGLKSFVFQLDSNGSFKWIKSGGNVGKSIAYYNQEIFVIGESVEDIPTVFENDTLPILGYNDLVIAKLSGLVSEITCSSQSSIIAFPNPAHEEVRIEHELCGWVKLYLYDYNGRLVIEKSCFDCDNFEILRNSLNSGSYIAVISNNEDLNFAKIIFD